MTILETLLFGIVAGLITLKVALLAAAAVLLVYVLAERSPVAAQDGTRARSSQASETG
jgi:hypothetical protein